MLYCIGSVVSCMQKGVLVYFNGVSLYLWGVFLYCISVVLYLSAFSKEMEVVREALVSTMRIQKNTGLGGPGVFLYSRVFLYFSALALLSLSVVL